MYIYKALLVSKLLFEIGFFLFALHVLFLSFVLLKKRGQMKLKEITLFSFEREQRKRHIFLHATFQIIKIKQQDPITY